MSAFLVEAKQKFAFDFDHAARRRRISSHKSRNGHHDINPLYLRSHRTIIVSGSEVSSSLKFSRGEQMNGPNILDEIRVRLAGELSAYHEPISRPLQISPWVAMSLLQKAI